MKTVDLRQDLMGGIDLTPRPTPGSARDIVNMSQNENNAWYESKGFEPYYPVTGLSTSLRCDTLHFFNQRGARDWILMEYNGTLTAITGPRAQTLASGRHQSETPWSKTQYITMGRWVYFINGVDAPQRWDGKRLSAIGFTKKPGSPQVLGPNEGFREVDLSPGSDPYRFLTASKTKGFADAEGLGSAGKNKNLEGAEWLVHTELDRYNCYVEDRGVGDYPADLTLPTVSEEKGEFLWGLVTATTTTESLPQVVPQERYPWVYGYAVSWINDRGMESPLSDMVIITGSNLPCRHPFDKTPLNHHDLNSSGSVSYKVNIQPSPGGGEMADSWEGYYSVYDNNGTGKAFVSVQVPGAPSHIRAIRVYRTENLNPLSSDATTGWSRLEESQRRQNLYLVHESKSCAPFSLADGKPDKELTHLYSGGDGLFSSDASLMAVFRGTMFIAGMASEPDLLKYSNPLFIEQFPKDNYFRLTATMDGPITGLYATDSVLYVFKRRSIYAILDSGGEGFKLQPISRSLGTTSPNAIVGMPTGGILFLSDSGIYEIKGAAIKKISSEIDRYWNEKVVKTALLKAVAVTDDKNAEVWFQVPTGSGGLEGIVYHYPKGATKSKTKIGGVEVERLDSSSTGTWSRREGYNAQCFTIMNDHRDNLLFGYERDTLGQVLMVYNGGIETFDGDPKVQSSYACAPLDFQTPWNRADVLYFSPFVLHYGDRELSVNYRVDRKQVVELSTPETRESVNTEELLLKWGETKWGEGNWQSYEMTTVAFPIRALAFEWDFSITATKMLVVSYDIGVAPNMAATQIRKLDLTLAPDMK